MRLTLDANDGASISKEALHIPLSLRLGDLRGVCRCDPQEFLDLSIPEAMAVKPEGEVALREKRIRQCSAEPRKRGQQITRSALELGGIDRAALPAIAGKSRRIPFATKAKIPEEPNHPERHSKVQRLALRQLSEKQLGLREADLLVQIRSLIR